MSAELKESILDILKQWAREVTARTRFDRIFAFGSLLYSGGEQFSEELSDIDVIATFSEELTLSSAERVAASVSLLPLIEQLEHSLMRAMRRAAADRPIVSVVAITSAEWRYGIHKDGKAAFFTTNDFYRLDEGRNNGPRVESEALYNRKWERLLSAIQETQKFRNLFLRISANGTRQVIEWDSATDPLPKAIMRAAAQVHHFADGKTDDTRYDVNEGYTFLTNLLYSKRMEGPSFRDLHKWLVVRGGGRGTRSAFKPESHLLLWEMLFDAALKYLTDVPSRAVSIPAPDELRPSGMHMTPPAPPPLKSDAEGEKKIGSPRTSVKETMRESLNTQLDSLRSDYEAANKQWKRATPEVERNRLKRQMADLQAEMEQLEKEIESLN